MHRKARDTPGRSVRGNAIFLFAKRTKDASPVGKVHIAV